MDIRDSPPPIRPKRGVGRPRKDPLLVELEGEEVPSKTDVVDDLVVPPVHGSVEATVPEENWNFECMCGLTGINLDGMVLNFTLDGTPIISCEGCDTWCHIICLLKVAGEEVTAEGIEVWRKKDYTCQKCLIKAADEDPIVASVP
jgi:hypothetical protein